MNLDKDICEFCKSMELDSAEMLKSVGEIAKKLNKEYYDLDGDDRRHMHVVGSVGRKTAIKNASDLDLLFVLPKTIYDKYDNYESNGQSALLQEVKSVLQTRYPKTDLRGDGQVVVINFNSYTVELVPAFRKQDNSFYYPDTHDGGSWKTTNPLPEIDACRRCNEQSSGYFFDFCHVIRAWKNQVGFEFSGLLIDTLIARHIVNEKYYEDSDRDYFMILMDIFKYLSSCNANQKYWNAIGSNQQITDKGKGAFVGKAKKAYSRLVNSIEDNNTSEVLADLLGDGFPHEKKRTQSLYEDTEEYIEWYYPVDIRYSLQIDCRITQDGFRPFLLSSWLRKGGWLRHNRKLEFFINFTTCPNPYDVCWKVRNVGIVAEKKNMIRGQIQHTNKKTHNEHTDFFGPHYVECYIIKNGVCVARDKIAVPIDN